MHLRLITTVTAIVSWIPLAYGQPVLSQRELNPQSRPPWNSRVHHEAGIPTNSTSVRITAQTADSLDHRARSAADSPSTPPYVISTAAGSERLHDGGTALVAPLRSPRVVVADNAGTFYIGDIRDYRVRKVAGGTIGTYAGVGLGGYSGDGLPASQAAISRVTGMALDAAGNLYLADWDNERVRKIGPAGVITTIAGNGDFFYEGDGGQATATAVDAYSIAVDAKGNIYIADALNYRIRKVTPAGVISTIAGNGNNGYTGDGGPATSAQIGPITGIAVDTPGNVYFTDYRNNRIRKIDLSGIVTTVAGNGNSKFSGDGGFATLAQLDPFNVAVDGAGNLYVADWGNNRVRKITAATGVISTVAGNGNLGLTGDGGAATTASLSGPRFVSVDASGNLYIADQGNDRIRTVTPDGQISSIAGAPVGDGGLATSAFLDFPLGVTVDNQGDLLIADGDNNRIRKVVPGSTISTIAGTGVPGYGSGAGQATAALLDGPGGTAIDANGNVYIADTNNYRIRKMTPDGQISNIAGTGKSNFSGDGGPATAAEIGAPTGIAVDSSGNIYFTDQDFYRIRKIAPSGSISTIAGNGSKNFAGDGGPATAAQLDPFDVALDQNGNLYVADRSNNRIRKIDTTGNISTVAGSDTHGFSGDGGLATAASLSHPTGVAVDRDGHLYIADYDNFVVRWVSKSGVISTIAGNGKDFVYAGDGGQALAAQLDPIRVAVSGTTVFVADAHNDRVRKLTLQTPASLTLSGGDNQSGLAGTLLPSALKVTVTDQAGIPVAGVTVTFAVTAGSATLNPASAVTGQDGVASTQVTLGTNAGSITISATVSGLTVATFHLTTTAGPPPATISAGGVVGAGLSVPAVKAISPNGIISVFGQNFAPPGTLHQVGKGELVNGELPTNVMSVCVLVGTTPAPIFALTDTQVNFQAPALPASGTVSVQVATSCGTGSQALSNAEAIVVQASAPEFFYFKQSLDGKNPIAVVNAASGAYIGAPGLLPKATFVPAKPHDVLTLFATGLGATSPAFAPGVLPDKAASVVGTVKVQIGSLTLVSSDVLYVGVTPGYAGLYQINLRVPDSVPDGDQTVVVTVGGFTSPAGAFMTVKR